MQTDGVHRSMRHGYTKADSEGKSQGFEISAGSAVSNYDLVFTCAEIRRRINSVLFLRLPI